MGTTTKLTFEEFAKLPEQGGTIYELDEGELLMEPSPALRHNLIRQRITMELMQFVESRGLGVVVEEIDFRLDRDTVRNPDVAFITADHLAHVDFDRSPVEGAPALAIEVVSPSNRAEDMARKTQQYLVAGSQSVWVFYSTLRLVEIHSTTGIRSVREPEVLQDETLLPGCSLSLSYVFDGKK
jgi:Uma2 family endonuclease